MKMDYLVILLMPVLSIGLGVCITLAYQGMKKA